MSIASISLAAGDLQARDPIDHRRLAPWSRTSMSRSADEPATLVT